MEPMFLNSMRALKPLQFHQGSPFLRKRRLSGTFYYTIFLNFAKRGWPVILLERCHGSVENETKNIEEGSKKQEF